MDISEIERLIAERAGRDVLIGMEKMAFEVAYQESKMKDLGMSFAEFARGTRDSLLRCVYGDIESGEISIGQLRSLFSSSYSVEKLGKVLREIYYGE